jgi:hypothetical protein
MSYHDPDEGDTYYSASNPILESDAVETICLAAIAIAIFYKASEFLTGGLMASGYISMLVSFGIVLFIIKNNIFYRPDLVEYEDAEEDTPVEDDGTPKKSVAELEEQRKLLDEEIKNFEGPKNV